MSAPRCGHCGRTSHGFTTITDEGDRLCTPDTTTRPAQNGPTPPRRPVRRIDPKGAR